MGPEDYLDLIVFALCVFVAVAVVAFFYNQ